MIQLDYDVTPQDYATAISKNALLPEKFFKARMKMVLVGLGVFLILIIINLCIMAANVFRGNDVDVKDFVGVGVAGLVLLTLMLLLLKLLRSEEVLKQRRRLRAINKHTRSGVIDSNYWHRHTLELDESSLRVRYGETFSEYSYGWGLRAERYAEGIKICHNNSICEIIPQSAFADDWELEEFFLDLQERFRHAHNEGVLHEGISHEDIEKVKLDSVYILKYTLDKPDFIRGYAKAARMALRTRLVWTHVQIPVSLISLVFIFGCVLAVIMLFTAIVSGSGGPAEILRSVFMFVGCFIWSFFSNISPLSALFASNAAASQMRKGDFPQDYFETQVLCVRKDKMTFFRSESRFDTSYSRVYMVRQNEAGVYILLKDKAALVIPDSAFASAIQKDEVVRFMKAEIS
jgi:hypothetical protein